jgi:hypothetical protein
MTVINNVNEVLHKIRVKLYPNYLPDVQGAYIACMDNEASPSIEGVCTAAKNRGSFTGNYDDPVEHIKQFFDEAAYQFCGGFAVNTGHYSLYPNGRYGGTFDKITESHDEKKYPVTFRFRTRAPFRVLAEHIEIEIEGLADVTGYIDKRIDVTSGAVNETLTSGGIFSLSGHKIKVEEDNPDVGIYFVFAVDAAQSVKVTGHLAENTGSKVIGIIPALAAGYYKGEIKTQYTVGGAMLKEPRMVESGFTVTVPE